MGKSGCLYEFVEETSAPSLETFESLGKRLLEGAEHLGDHLDKIIPLFRFGMAPESDQTVLPEIIEDLALNVRKVCSS